MDEFHLRSRMNIQPLNIAVKNPHICRNASNPITTHETDGNAIQDSNRYDVSASLLTDPVERTLQRLGPHLAND